MTLRIADPPDPVAAPRSPLVRALGLLRGHAGLAGVVLLLTVLSVLVALLTPWLFGQAVAAIEDEDESRIISLGAAVIGAGIVAALLQAGGQLLAGRLAVDVELGLRERVYRHLLGLDSDFYRDRQVGELVSVIMVTSGPIRRFLAVSLPRITSDLLTFAFAGIAMLVIDPRLAVVTLWPIPIVVYLVIRMARVVTPAMKERQEVMADITATAEETMREILTVDVLSAQGARASNFDETTTRWYDVSARVSKMTSWYDSAIQNLPDFAWAGLFLFGGFSVVAGRLELSTFVTFLGYVGLMLAPVGNLGYRLWTTQSASASSQRVFEILDYRPLVADRDGAADLEDGHGTVGFREVTKSFDGISRALDVVELDIVQQRNVAIVGRTGSGKSALLGLIARVHDPETGEVSIGGRPVGDVRLASLRSKVVSVGRNPHLFPMNVLENLRYANPSTPRAEIERVVRTLGVHDRIEQLPQGYETEVGDGASSIDPQLAQCISLARAIVGKPTILLLDDVTAPLPPSMERTVIDGLRTLTDDLTIVAVTSRPAMLGVADDIVLLADGTVSAQGSFDRLTSESVEFGELLAAWRLRRSSRLEGDG